MSHRHVAIMMLGLIPMLWPLNVLSQPRHYAVHFGASGRDEVHGYAELDISNRHITGKICTHLGTIKVDGKSPWLRKNDITLEFQPDAEARQTILKHLLPNNPATLWRTPPREDDDRLEGLMNGSGWEIQFGKDQNKILNLVEISRDIKTPKRDRYANLKSLSSTEEFDLAKFDGMTPEQALSLVSKTKWDELIEPARVLILYKPADRDKIAAFLNRYGDLAHLGGPPPSDCGAPFVEDSVLVPALLDLYFARMLQTTGLVARAFPMELPRTPEFTPIELRMLDLKNTLKYEALNFNDNDKIRTFFDAQIRKFLAAKRPRFKAPWQIELRPSGVPFIFRWQVVGASISSCQPSLWEKFDIQIAFMPSFGTPTVGLQALDGYEAPGSFDQRPSDARFKDNGAV